MSQRKHECRHMAPMRATVMCTAPPADRYCELRGCATRLRPANADNEAAGWHVGAAHDPLEGGLVRRDVDRLTRWTSTRGRNDWNFFSMRWGADWYSKVTSRFLQSRKGVMGSESRSSRKLRASSIASEAVSPLACNTWSLCRQPPCRPWGLEVLAQ